MFKFVRQNEAFLAAASEGSAVALTDDPPRAERAGGSCVEPPSGFTPREALILLLPLVLQIQRPVE